MKNPKQVSMTALPPVDVPTAPEFEFRAAAVTANRALKIAVVSMGIAMALMGLALMKTSAAAAHVRPYIVRISEVGRAGAVSYQLTGYRPQAPEIRYFLSHLTHDYYARVHATVRHDYVIAQWFLDRQSFQQVDDRDRKTQWLPKFLSSTGDDAEVTVSDVVIENLEQEPYRARVEFTKVFTNSAGQQMKRERWTAACVFRVNPNVPNEAIPYNPLGIAITYLRSDQAFE